MKESRMPAWLDDARLYYSEIGEDSTQPVSVFVSDSEEFSSESPGTLCLRLEPRSRYSPRMRVLDAGGRAEGIIRSEGLVPGVRYAMHRNGETVWMLSVRSIVRQRHALELFHRFRRHLAGRYTVVEITPALFNEALRLANTHAMRAYDAVQLAAALEIRQQRQKTGFGPVTLISADQALNDAAPTEGLTVDDPRSHP
jgi:predicted nucleic acid-binding protein